MAAGVTSIDVPTKGGGATARDRAQDGSPSLAHPSSMSWTSVYQTLPQGQPGIRTRQ